MPLLAVNRHPTPRMLRTFAVLWGVFALLFWLKFHHAGKETAASGSLITGALMLPGLVWRGWWRWAFIATSYVAFPLGFVFSHLLLAVAYFVGFTGLGWLMRLFGYDPLGRRLDRQATSYWRRREGSRPAASYFKQY